MDREFVADIDGGRPEHPVLATEWSVGGGDRLALFDEGPIGFDPDGVFLLPLDAEYAARCVELPAPAGGLEPEPGPGPHGRRPDDLITLEEVEVVLSESDDDVSLGGVEEGSADRRHRMGLRPEIEVW